MALSALIGCSPNVLDEIDLMPSPTLHAETGFDPFEDITAEDVEDRSKLFYVTDRSPVEPGDPQGFYNNERGVVVRAGVADVTVTPPFSGWEEVREITLSPEREEDYVLRIRDVQETGVMPFSIVDFIENPPQDAEMDAAGRQFAAQVNAQLASSANKDIFIYTHGYNIDFDYSTLVSKQLQHFLGYQGAFISYNWPATPSTFAYFRDLESAAATRRNLRKLIEFLSDNTDARKIHLIGYSAGTRLAFDVAYQIALQSNPKPRIGQLILIGSDLDRANFLQGIEDGLLETLTSLTLYQSKTDGALGVSRFVFGRERVGETPDGATIGPRVRANLAGLDNLHIVNVTDAEKSNIGNGHWYFRSSPWVSSDLFVSLLSGLEPGARGLVRAPGDFVWEFPSNYPEVLQGVASGL